MKFYPESYDVAVKVLFTDPNGEAVVPTAINARLYDGDDVEILDMPALPFDPEAGEKEVVIAAVFNELSAGELSAVRILRVEIVTAAGSIRRSHSYVIEGESRMEVMNNTFITLEAAAVVARDVPNLTGWETASDEQRTAALINAFTRMTRIPMRFSTPNDLRENWQMGEEVDTVILASAWKEITAAEFLSYPIDFRKAVRIAQVIEANEILANNPMSARHRAGIISETVGESSVMLRGGRLELGVSSETLRYLTGFVYYDHRIWRA